jgi:hypothetical protein
MWNGIISFIIIFPCEINFIRKSHVYIISIKIYIYIEFSNIHIPNNVTVLRFDTEGNVPNCVIMTSKKIFK